MLTSLKVLAPDTFKAALSSWLWNRRYERWITTERGQASHRRLVDLRYKFAARPCVVIGNGPSLAQVDLSLLADVVTIGSNGIFLLTERTGFKPTVYTIEDRLVAADRCKEAEAYDVAWKIFPFDLYPVLGGCGDALFVNCSRRVLRDAPRFSEDLSRIIYWGGTVTYFNLQVAVYLGCNPIILVGVDHSYSDSFKIAKKGNVWTSEEDDVNHFDSRYFGRGYRWHNPQVHRMEAAYRSARRFAEAKGIEIINATDGGKLEVFSRVPLEDCLRSKTQAVASTLKF
jgi:hypothetical protein